MITTLLVNAIRMGTIFLFGSTGETVMEKAGHLNLGIPGIMCMGAFGGCWGVSIYMSLIGDGAPVALFLILTALIFSALVSSLGALIYAFLTVTFRANQNVTGLALTTFGVGFMKFFGTRINGDYLIRAHKCFKNLFPFSDKLGAFGEIFFSHGVMVYLAIFLALFVWYFLFKTRKGLQLRAIGENPATADAVGINVEKYKYLSIIAGCIIAGFGGLYYVMDKTNGTTFVEAPIESFGWLAVALVIFTLWKPNYAILGSIVFGALTVAASVFTIPLKMIKLFDVVPYVVTIAVLIVTSVLDSKENQPPASLGLAYFREER